MNEVEQLPPARRTQALKVACVVILNCVTLMIFLFLAFWVCVLVGMAVNDGPPERTRDFTPEETKAMQEVWVYALGFFLAATAPSWLLLCFRKFTAALIVSVVVLTLIVIVASPFLGGK